MKRLFQPLEFILAVAVLITACAAFKAVAYAVERNPNEHLNYYPDTGIVTDVDEVRGIVTITNGIGIAYSFFGDGYELGDVCSLMMDDMDTRSNVYDDEIIDARFSGMVSNFVREWNCDEA